MNIRRLRRQLRAFEHLPVHPQWFAYKRGSSRYDLLQHAMGITVDVGCADKNARRYLPASCHYIGMDYYATASTLYRTQPDVYGDAALLPFADRSIDTLILLEVLEHVPEPRAALREAARIIRPGGKLLLSVPFLYPIHDAPRDYHRFTQYALTENLAAVGFVPKVVKRSMQSYEVTGLLSGIALADSARLIVERHRWAIFVVPFIAVLVVLINLMAWILGKLLPSSDIMPGGYEIFAVRTE